MVKEHPEAYKFHRVYANIPLRLRSTEICCVIDDEPMTFQVVRQEIKNNTEAGNKAIKQLLRNEFI